MAKRFFKLFPEDFQINRNMLIAGATFLTGTAGGIAYHTITSGVSLFSLSFSQVAVSGLLGFGVTNSLLVGSYFACKLYNFLGDVYNNAMKKAITRVKDIKNKLQEPEKVQFEPVIEKTRKEQEAVQQPENNLPQQDVDHNEELNNQAAGVSEPVAFTYYSGRGGRQYAVQRTAAADRPSRTTSKPNRLSF